MLILSGVLGAKPGDLEQIYNGNEEDKPEIIEDSVKAIMGVGTGLGQSILVKEETGKWKAIHTEGGYADFHPHDDEEFRFLKFLQYLYLVTK